MTAQEPGVIVVGVAVLEISTSAKEAGGFRARAAGGRSTFQGVDW
jgi:hypothetical protein